MKLEKLFGHLKELVNSDLKKVRKEQSFLKEILAELKGREKGLKQKLEEETDEETRERFKKDIAIVHAQRKKGLKVLGKIKDDEAPAEKD